jgi:CHAT domain-containing protein
VSREYLAFAPIFDKGESAEQRFSQIAAGDSTRGRNTGYLAATKAEVLNIENLFRARAGWLDRLLGRKTQVWLEQSASEKNAKSPQTKNFRYVHFATHGFANSANPKLSGLLLAHGNDSGEDGILHLSEIYNMSLNADLVVLSACETGLGKIAEGEGLIGLTRGFLYAGAQNLLVSLWQINDAGTAQLMVEFYRNLLDGRSQAEALRAAKLTLRQNRAELAPPYYWAPFVLIGR